MNRRTVLKALGGVPIVAVARSAKAEGVRGQTSSAWQLDDAGFVGRYPFRVDVRVLRLCPHPGPDPEHSMFHTRIGDAGAPLDPGTVYYEFYETWEKLAESTFDKEDDKKNRRFVSRHSTDRVFRVIDVVKDPHAAPCVGDYHAVILPADFSIARLALITEAHIWHTDTEFVIAENQEHAAQLYKIFLGWNPEHPLPPPGEGEPGFYAADWEKWSDDKPFPLTEEAGDCEDLEMDDDGVVHVEQLRDKGFSIFQLYKDGKLDREEQRRYRECKAPVAYASVHEGEVTWRVTRKLPTEWVEELGFGWFSSTEA